MYRAVRFHKDRLTTYQDTHSDENKIRTYTDYFYVKIKMSLAYSGKLLAAFC